MNNNKVKTLCSRVPKWVFDPVLPILLLVFTAAVLVYYITGPMLATFHSDFTDSLLWANVTAETGQILSPDYNYAAILPFGSPLWMVPILKIFGYGRTAFMASMIVFVPIFMGSGYYFFRSFKWNRLSCAMAVCCFCLVMSGSTTLLEMLWGHTIYYSLSLLFWMLLMGLTLRLVDTTREWKQGKKLKISRILELVCVSVLCAGCATDGFQVLALSVAPVAGALIACAFFDNIPLLDRGSMRKYAVVGLMLISSCVGIVILRIITKNGAISASYANGHMYWTPTNNWVENLQSIFPAICDLFGISVPEKLKLFSLKSVFCGLRLLLLLFVLAAPVAMLLRYRKLSQSKRIALWGHLLLTGVIGFMYIFGMLSYGNWRLIPCVGTGVIITVLWVSELLAGTRVEKRVAAALAALMAAVCLANVWQVAKMPRNVEDNSYWQVTQVLKEKGYDYGFASFWNSHPIVLLSDNEIQVTTVYLEEGELTERHYQNYRDAFEPRQDKETCFLLMETNEYRQMKDGAYMQRLRESRNLVDSFQCGKFIVLVFDGSVIV